MGSPRPAVGAASVLGPVRLREIMPTDPRMELERDDRTPPRAPDDPGPERERPSHERFSWLWPLGGLGSRLQEPGSFSRSVLTLMTGTTLANVIPIAVAPILARLYSPSDFGLFALYAGVVALLAAAATGRYELAIVLPAEDEDAFHLLGLSLLIATAVAAGCALLAWGFHSGLVAALRAPALSTWLYLVPIGVLLAGSAQALTSWLNRKRAYTRIAQSRFLQAVTTAALTIAVASAGLGPGGLIVGAVAGQVIATALLAFVVWRGLGSSLHLTPGGMRSQAARYRDFPRVNALHALFDNLSVSGTVILLSWFFDAVVVGHYSMAMRVLTAPVALIGAAIAQVFYQRAADLQNRGADLRPLLGSMLKRSVGIALPATLLLVIVAPSLFTFAFGPEWAAAGTYARLLSPYMFFAFVAAPLAFLPLVLNRQWQSFLLSTTGNLLFLASIAVGGLRASPELGLGVLSVVQAIYFVAYIAWMLRIAARPQAVPA